MKCGACDCEIVSGESRATFSPELDMHAYQHQCMDALRAKLVSAEGRESDIKKLKDQVDADRDGWKARATEALLLIESMAAQTAEALAAAEKRATDAEAGHQAYGSGDRIPKGTYCPTCGEYEGAREHFRAEASGQRLRANDAEAAVVQAEQRELKLAKTIDRFDDLARKHNYPGAHGPQELRDAFEALQGRE